MKKGFTLIELLIVIAIIGVLAVAFLPNLMGAPAKARDAQRMEDVKKISGFLTEYYLSHPNEHTTASRCLSPDDNTSISGVINSNIDRFNGIFPSDPLTTNPTISTSFGCDAGEYLVYRNASWKARFGFNMVVSARVENEESGNGTRFYGIYLSGPPQSIEFIDAGPFFAINVAE